MVAIKYPYCLTVWEKPDCSYTSTAIRYRTIDTSCNKENHNLWGKKFTTCNWVTQRLLNLFSDVKKSKKEDNEQLHQTLKLDPASKLV